MWTDWLTYWLACWWTDWRTQWLFDWLTDWLTYWPTDWLTNWLTIWPTDWLFNWLTHWLTDWLADWHTYMLSDWLTDMQNYRWSFWDSHGQISWLLLKLQGLTFWLFESCQFFCTVFWPKDDERDVVDFLITCSDLQSWLNQYRVRVWLWTN